MKKQYAWLLVVGALIVAVGVYAVWLNQGAKVGQTPPVPVTDVVDPLNATYVVDGTPVTLVKGKAETGTGSAKLVTMVFGVPVIGDVNGDGRNDSAVLLTQSTGGSGTFYYVAVALRTDEGNVGTNALLLGDRVAPQNVQITNKQVLVNYADRKPGEPMSTAPSMGVTLTAEVDGILLKRVEVPVTTISYLTSSAERAKFCNGVDMDSEGYRKTITVVNTTSTKELNPTRMQVITETIHAATTSMCQNVFDQLKLVETNGVVTIPPIDAWAGFSITMCTCRPIVETNLLRIPGIIKVIWQ